jgi:alanine racemase
MSMDGNITWAEIDLDAIKQNIQTITHFIGEGVEVIGVLKANAYGHGAAPIAQAAVQAGISRLAVHRLSEGTALRHAGIKVPILIMGYTPPEGAFKILNACLTPSVITLEFAKALSIVSRSNNKTTSIHIKVDTGMSRYGLMPDEVLAFAKKLLQLPGLFLEGIFTHLATSELVDQSFAHEQLIIFEQVLKTLKSSGIEFPLIHAASSAAIVKFPEAYFNAVRLGIFLYGGKSSKDFELPFELRSALTLKSIVSRVRVLPPGSAISYNRTYILKEATRVALVPVGYGDGYPRNLSNRASVLIHGKRARIIGMICMDQFVVDISEIPEVKQDDEVVLIGKQGTDFIGVEELAELANTNSNEIMTSLSSRVARYYIQNNNLIAKSATR